MDIKKTEFKQVKYPAYAEIKMDGEFVMFDGISLENDYGTDRTDKIDIKFLPKDCLLLGEMYYNDGKEYFSELHSHRQEQMKFIWFDCFTSGTHKIYKERRSDLERLSLPIVEARLVNNEQELQAYFKEVVDRGYEGVVVKPLEDVSAVNWVKIKREYSLNLYVKGVRKGIDGQAKQSVAVGDKQNIFGCVSVSGWLPVVEEISRQQIIGQNKDYWFVEPKLILEVKHSGWINGKKLRNPVIKRIRDYREEVASGLPTLERVG